MEIQINRIKGNNLSMLIKKMLLMDSQVYLTIENNKIFSNVYLPTKDVVKITSMDLNEIFEFDEPITKPIKMGFFNGSKVITALGYFDSSALHGSISYSELDGELYAEYLILKDNSLNIKISCQDPELGFVTMTNDQLNIVFSDTGKKYEFDIVEADLQKILNLNGLDTSELFEIYGNELGIHIKGDNYDFVVDDSTKGSFDSVHLHKKFLNKLDKENYNIIVCKGEQNKVILTSKSTKTKLALNLALGVN